jgi:hypothetical protein
MSRGDRPSFSRILMSMGCCRFMMVK